MFTITKSFNFEAAHHLPQMPEGHQCKRQHGHSYRVIVELSAKRVEPRTGFVRDFGELSIVKDFLDQHFDHRDLAEIVGGQNTTAELLAEFLFLEFRSKLPELTAVTVCETEKTTATFRLDR